MKPITSIQDMKAWSKGIKSSGKTLGFVPTMGYLHAGHLALVKKSLMECDRTVVSIFINPKQFGPGEDLEAYPIDLARDSALLEGLGVDILFLPECREMFPEGYKTYVTVEEVTDHLCGKSRPGFFRGVATVVLKLFQIVQPDKAVFGEKDWQQLQVIRTLVRDMCLDTKIIAHPIVREADGLAMSSRNAYLSKVERKEALSLSSALEEARDNVLEGESSAQLIRQQIKDRIELETTGRVDYISICDPVNFNEIEEVQESALIALAVHFGKARLIDNCLVERVPCKK